MSAALKATTALSGLAVVGYAAKHALATPDQHFAQNSLTAAGHGAESVGAQAPAPKMPSNFIQISFGDWKWNNARGGL
ncbi:hypothetical protein D0869_00270 [Hortaea werneckii]|uniref:Uncharacterized protein n=1 Tax=Hortaea werneckii TaxID=91943 RepID=A0A3M6YXE7_HORWE|nr:hypothetical protein KC324_g5881 [Hortaea werneckii]KAI7239090.1 hypothetical protein KC330_g2107 [Hortaea werneckii]KAI7544081.1 hypothetical protein KC316_g15065 [Hortaea werneckii]RMX90211.1 hypothetical protein D0869_00270 [Hortaea werneckii]RMY07683.1 hypothetical protein D0868_05217 [Hortaea werneckii]